MAKKHNTETHAESGNVTVEIPAGLVLKYGDWSIDATTASPATLAYCLLNGYHQSMVDAAAFSKDDKTNEDGTPKSESEVTAMANEMRQKRHDNIVNGTVGSRVGGPRVRGIDKLIRDVATEKLIALSVAKNKPMPKGKGAAEKIGKLVDMYLSDATRAEVVRAEAQRRLDAAADVGDFDLGDAA